MQVLRLGKEIYIFFGKYNICGIFGMLLSCIIIGYLIFKVFKIIEKNINIKTYNDFMCFVMNKNDKSKEFISNFKLIINIFLLISFYIMGAGFCTYFKQQYNFPGLLIAIAISIGCFIVLNKSVEGVIKISTILVPIIIIFIVQLGIGSFKIGAREILEMNINLENVPKSMISSILYSSYNSIILLPTVISIKKYIKKREFKTVAIIISSVIFILGILVYIILFSDVNNVELIEMPIVHIVKEHNKDFKYLYGIVIIISIFTSMISSGYGFLKNCSENEIEYKKYLLYICIGVVFVCNISFSILVKFIYPIFGVLGAIQIYYILKIKT